MSKKFILKPKGGGSKESKKMLTAFMSNPYIAYSWYLSTPVRGFSRERIVVGHAACSLFGKASEFNVRVRVRL